MIKDFFPVNQKKKKIIIMPGEKSCDKTPKNPQFRLKIEMYNVIYNQILRNLNYHFENHGYLYREISHLDPRYFKENLAKNSCN